MADIKLAIYGFNVNVGSAFFDALDGANIKIDNIFPLAYGANQYDAVKILDKNYAIRNPEEFDFAEANVFLVFTDDHDAKKLIAEAQDEGCFIIDARNNSDSVNFEHVFLNDFSEVDLEDMLSDNYIVPMNSTSSLLALTLKPLVESFRVNHCAVTVMEAASSLGTQGASELARETIALLNMRPVEPKLFEKQMAFNVHTSIGDVQADGVTTHEFDVLNQLSTVLGDNNVDNLSLNTVLVPVFYGDTATFAVTFDKAISTEELRATWEDYNFIEMCDDEELTPASHGNNEDKIFISRLRNARNPQTIQFTAVMDNAKRGLALNIVSILKKYSEAF